MLVKSRFKNIFRVLIRIGLSGLAVYVVLRNIEIGSTKRIFLGAEITWLILALIAFNMSKIISAFRLNSFFRTAGLFLKWQYNLKLYYAGMFYNLFLPGGIGGDGYKVYLLNKFYKTPLKPLIAASLLDRISGMAALVFLAFLLFLPLGNRVGGTWLFHITWILAMLIYPAYYLIQKIFFRNFNSVFIAGNIYSLAVQFFQLISAFFILRSLGVESLYAEYLVLFLASSAIAVLPFTIGGFGARELVFIVGSDYLGIDRNTAIAFSVIFFIITAVSSFTGIFLKTDPGMKN